MEAFVTVVSVVLFLSIAWQVLGSIWNIINIVVGIFKG